MDIDIMSMIPLSIEKIKRENLSEFQEICLKEGHADASVQFNKSLKAYLTKIITEKLGKDFKGKIEAICDRISEIITGDYEIGKIGDTFEQIDSRAENIATVIAYSDNESLNESLKTSSSDELAETIADGSVKSGIAFLDDEEINEEVMQKAESRFEKKDSKLKAFFDSALHNLLNIKQKIVDKIADVSGLNSGLKEGLNDNVVLKNIGGVAYALLSGAYVGKRHFTEVTRSESMLEQIEQNGILHFSSLDTINKIMDSGMVKKSDFITSDLTKKKSFFFAGPPTFEDLLINIPATDVMTAVRIKPTEEQLGKLKYRALNDRAVVNDGDFHFNREQAEIAYFGLMYDNDKKTIYLGEISEEQAKDFEVSPEVKEICGDNFKLSQMNAYGMIAEYRHHQKLLELKKTMRERGMSLKDIDDATLVELSDIQNAYVSCKDDAVGRKSIFDKIKDKVRGKSIEREDDYGRNI